MSLLNTKPRYFPSAVATESGWCNPITGEVLVSVGRLKTKLAAEAAALEEKWSNLDKTATVVEIIESKKQPITTPLEVAVEPVVAAVEPIVEQPKEVVMEEIKPVKVRKEHTRKVKVAEQTDKSVPEGQKILGEVVEHDLDKPVVGE